MAPQPENLLSMESALLLYLADELSPSQRQDVEQKLVSDPQWSVELARLRAAQAACESAFASADKSMRLPVMEPVAVRRVARARREWQMQKMMATPIQENQRRGAFPWWTYPVATAAALFNAFLTWSAKRPVGPMLADPSQA